MAADGTGLNIYGETKVEYLVRRLEERGADIEHFLMAIREAMDDLESNDIPGAEAILRTLLRKWQR